MTVLHVTDVELNDIFHTDLLNYKTHHLLPSDDRNIRHLFIIPYVGRS